MSPPLETNEKNTPSSTHSLGVDSELSLLSNSNASNDQAMDIFLNQVAEYNNQHVAFEQHQQASSSSSATAASGSQMNIDPSQILTHHQQQQQQKQQQTTKVKQEEQPGFAKPAEPPKKGKQKAKETGHSSLLHVSVGIRQQSTPCLTLKIRFLPIPYYMLFLSWPEIA